MPTRLTSSLIEPLSRHFQTQITDPTNVASADTRNVTQGAANLVAVEVDNMLSATNSKIWIKLFDNATSGWNPATTKPVFIMPVPAVVVAADADTRGDGVISCYCLEGYPFEEGISIAASKEDGDAAVAAPDDAVIVQLIHRATAAIISSSAPKALLPGLRTSKLGGGKETLRILIGRSDATALDDVSTTPDSENLTVYRVRINATQNPAEDVYVRLFSAQDATTGTTDAELLVPCKRGRDFTWEFPRGIPFIGSPGYLSVATVRNKGATSGNDSPTGIVDVIIDMASA